MNRPYVNGVRGIVSSLGALSEKWLRRGFIYRRRAVSELVERSGFSERMAEALLDALFSELTASKLTTLLKSELREPQALDHFVREKNNKRAVFVRGPRTIFHVFSASTPGVAVMSFVLGLLVKSENVGKMSTRDAGFLRVYLDSLKAHDPGLRKRCRLIPPKDRTSAVRWMRQADLVVAYGSDESLAKIQKSIPVKTPFIGYGHRMSFSLIMKEALDGKGTKRLARQTAYDIWMSDQRGCLSSSTILVQKGGKVCPEIFAELIATELKRFEEAELSQPKRGLSEHLAFRRDYERAMILKLKNGKAHIWQSQTPARWTVMYDEKPDIVPSGPGQRVVVKGFVGLDDLEGALRRSSAYLQAVALECSSPDRVKLAGWLAAFGVNRVCRAGKLQHPPSTWHHDGHPNLAGWLRWTDLED